MLVAFYDVVFLVCILHFTHLSRASKTFTVESHDYHDKQNVYLELSFEIDFLAEAKRTSSF